MKSSYELAMERLNKSSPVAKLSVTQKKELAELDSLYAAKVAEREIFLKGELERAREKVDAEAFGQINEQLSHLRKNLNTELEEKKDKIRNAPMKKK